MWFFFCQCTWFQRLTKSCVIISRANAHRRNSRNEVAGPCLLSKLNSAGRRVCRPAGGRRNQRPLIEWRPRSAMIRRQRGVHRRTQRNREKSNENQHIQLGYRIIMYSQVNYADAQHQLHKLATKLQSPSRYLFHHELIHSISCKWLYTANVLF